MSACSHPEVAKIKKTRMNRHDGARSTSIKRTLYTLMLTKIWEYSSNDEHNRIVNFNLDMVHWRLIVLVANESESIEMANFTGSKCTMKMKYKRRRYRIPIKHLIHINVFVRSTHWLCAECILHTHYPGAADIVSYRVHFAIVRLEWVSFVRYDKCFPVECYYIVAHASCLMDR